jgi:hypothetical protein
MLPVGSGAMALGGDAEGRMAHPVLYQVNTRIVLSERAAVLGRPATLDDLPDADLDAIAALGFDWVWLLGVWQTGDAGRRESLRRTEEWRTDAALLADFADADVCGSPFAITGYTVHRDFGGDEALARLRARLAGRGLRLMLDVVPNHTALDHAWLAEHPEYYVRGSPADRERAPGNWFEVGSGRRSLILAHGRDPFFDGWTDTAQLDYRTPELRAAMLEELRSVASRCDGVRCDMAMLLEPDVFARTWGGEPVAGDDGFWPAAIAAIRADRPGFVFMAEVYWDLEWRLQRHGFDFTYDKRLYDRLRAGAARPVRDHLAADAGYSRRSARFLENHDEPRAAAVFPPGRHRSAAVISYLVPGLALFHEGQLDGRRIRASLHLRRRPPEPVDPGVRSFYEGLLEVLRLPVVREGTWMPLACRPAWPDNPTWDAFLAFRWSAPGERDLLVVVNRSDTQAQCYVELDPGGAWRLELADLLNPGLTYTRSGDELREAGGMYFDMGPDACHAFQVTARA